jgi:hypothetical protein
MHPSTGEPYDIFLSSGKGEIAADVQALGRLISILLRWPDRAAINQATRLEIIRDQLFRIPGGQQVGFGPDATISMPDGIAHLLHDYLAAKFPMAGIPLGVDPMERYIGSLDEDISAEAAIRALITPASSHDQEQMSDADTADDTTSFIDLVNESSKGYSSAPLDMCPECKQIGLLRQIGHCPHCVICGVKLC